MLKSDAARTGAVDVELAGFGVIADHRLLAVAGADLQPGALGGVRAGGRRRSPASCRARRQRRAALRDRAAVLAVGRGRAQRPQLPDGLLDDLHAAVDRAESDLPRDAHRAAPWRGRDLVGVLPVVHPPDHQPSPAGDVVPGDRRVVVLAVVEPAGALLGRLRRRVGEHDLIGEDVAPAAAVAVGDLDPGIATDQLARRSRRPSRAFSLSLPAALRTTSPSTSRFTAVSSERIRAGASANMKWSARMWPQPPVFRSTISTRARLAD